MLRESFFTEHFILIYGILLQTDYFGSVLKGDAGNPSLLYKFTSGTFDQPYRTATGFSTPLPETIISFPCMIAFAGTKILSDPAIVNPLRTRKGSQPKSINLSAA